MFPDKLDRLSHTRFDPMGVPYRRGPDSLPMVFVCDTGDLFHERVTDEFIERALDVFTARDDVTWQVLTKRADRMEDAVTGWLHKRGRPEVPENIWLLTTVENQEATWRIPHLLRIPAFVRGLSIEPMIGRIDLRRIDDGNTTINPLTGWYHTTGGMSISGHDGSKLNWVIVGGESGREARPMLSDWATFLHEQCSDAMASFFFKQESAAGEHVTSELATARQFPQP
jgi:protein gp37